MAEAQTPQELLTKYRYKGKLTPKLRKAACELVEKGSPPKTAVVALGVGESTYRLWRDNAADENSDPKYKEFFWELAAAEQRCFSEVSCNASQATKRDGKVALDFLGRRDEEHWGRTDKLDVDMNFKLDASPTFKAMAEAQQKLLAGGYHVRGDGDEPGIEEAQDEPPLLLKE